MYIHLTNPLALLYQTLVLTFHDAHRAKKTGAMNLALEHSLPLGVSYVVYCKSF